MFYSFFAAIFLALVAVSTSDLYTNDLQNVLARFYTNFAHLYVRYPPTSADTLGLPADPSVEYYQFLFTAKGYSQIAEESLSMLNTHVLERTVTYHATPNFEMNDTRYFYRRDPKQQDAIEIESIDSLNNLFRDPQTDRYFYLSSFEGLEFMGNIPASPYYEVVFKCNSSFTQDTNSQLPILSFIDRTYKWTPRYLLDAPMFGGNNRSLMHAYADIRNTGENNIAIKALELIAGSIELIDKSVNYMPSSSLYSPNVVTFAFSAPSVSSLGEQASGTYVYQWPVPSDINLTSTSVKSIEFLQADVTVESFLVYSSTFSTINRNGKLNRAYNLTCRNAYLPEGRLILREQGRFVGEMNLPNLGMGEVYTMRFGFDAEVTYHRYVTITQGNINGESITYNVRYIFESSKPSRDIYLDFTESFWSAGYFEVKNISKLKNMQNSPAVQLIGTDLQGQIIIPHKPNRQAFSYDVTMYKFKPTTIRDQ